MDEEIELLAKRIEKRLRDNFHLPKKHDAHFNCALEEIMWEVNQFFKKR